MSGAGAGADPGAQPAARSRPFSVLRVALFLVVVVGASGGGVAGLRHDWNPPARVVDTWYAPYVDLTLTPSYAFEDPEVNPVDDVVLGFVVADPDDPCAPSWGATFGLDDAASALDLDRRIARYRADDGDVVVSFGGAVNDELAVACDDPDDLAAAYAEVIERYDVTTIDLDIEGPALADTASVARRAEALATVQDEARADDRDLTIWLTLPVAPSGLPGEALDVVDAMLAAEVDLGGVNVMTMNYGSSRPAETDMATATEEALDATRQQLGDAYRRADTRLDDEQLWRKIGATPMIGQNDEDADVFTRRDARALRAVALDRGLGRVSMWSANRDAPCDRDVVAPEVSNHCSGVDQDPLAFSGTFATLPGRPEASAGRRTVSLPEVPDDPRTSPYPVWTEEGVYEEGDKVVREGEVYVAQWWAEGEDPTAPADRDSSPWRLIGPVLETDLRPTPTTVAAGTYPEWDATAVYDEGDRVLLDGVAFETRWWTQGDEPGQPGDESRPNPWEPLAPDR